MECTNPACKKQLASKNPYLVLMSRFDVTKLFVSDWFRNVYSFLFIFIFFVVLYLLSASILQAQQVKTCKHICLDMMCYKLADVFYMSRSLPGVTNSCNSSFVFQV